MSSISFEVEAEKVNVDLGNDSVILTGVDLSELVSEIGTEELLNAMDYSDIVEYVAEIEKDKADEDYDQNSNR